jgi:hypothetical protein
LVDGKELDQASVSVRAARVGCKGSLGRECFLALVADPGFPLGNLGTGQDASCIHKSGLEGFEPDMFFGSGLPEAQASFGSFLESTVPVGVQCHVRDPRREVGCVGGCAGNLIKLQKPCKGRCAEGKPTVGPISGLKK